MVNSPKDKYNNYSALLRRYSIWLIYISS